MGHWFSPCVFVCWFVSQSLNETLRIRFQFRYLKKHIWSVLFGSFLNIKDIDHLPDLAEMREKIDNELYGMESELQKHIRTLSNILHKR